MSLLTIFTTEERSFGICVIMSEMFSGFRVLYSNDSYGFFFMSEGSRDLVDLVYNVDLRRVF